MNSYPRSHLRIAIGLAAVFAIVIFTLPDTEREALPSKPVSLEVSPEDISKPVVPVQATIPVAVPDNWVNLKVKPGDNLARIFQRINIPAADLQYIMDIGKEVASFRKIQPGQELSFLISATGVLDAIRYKKDAFQTLVVTRTEAGFAATWEMAEPEIITMYETGHITSDEPLLFHAGKAAGLSDNVIMKLSNIFQWDISFALDMRKGDSFSLMYEQIYVNGEKVKEGDIIAATFNNMGREYSAIRYTNLEGRTDYFTPTGQSMRKAFLRDPVHFSHVSSSFNLRRLHPIHNKVMPHRGIDYAAKQGTPVVAAGDGKVTIRRQNNASGKYVVIQHGEQYTTKYLHLSAFAGIKPGQSVRQGQTIGYVGATGWATAPHLHYEFLVGGIHRNPRTVALPNAEPVRSSEMNRFQTYISPVIAQLQSISGNQGLASSGEQSSASGG